jgi:nucleotide-binding universal stress UspA family protein
MTGKLVVALKERHEAGRLVAAAAMLVRRGGQADVVHVLELGSQEDFALADLAVTNATEQLQARGFVAEGHVHATASGTVANRLAQHTRESDADLVVMGSRGLGRRGGLLGRSVSHALLAETDLPVLVVPEKAHLSVRGIRRVLVAVEDESEAEAVAEALKLIELDAEVLVAHVPRRVTMHVGSHPGETFAEIPEVSTVVLEQVRQRLKKAGVEATMRTLPRMGSVAETVVGSACESEADLIVVGSRRLRDWEALGKKGSTSHAILHCSERPVLIAGRASRPVARETERPS